MNKVKLVAGIILAVLVVIVALQNTTMIDTKILFVEMTMPQAALLFGTFFVGFAVGALATGWMLRVRKPKS